MILIRQYGMIAYLRQQKGESCIIEPKLNQVKVKDLRLYNPWPELQSYVDSFDLGALPEMEHCHVPFAIILIKALQGWKLTHEGQAPKTMAEKNAFKAYIKSFAKWKGLNFDEAISNVNECYKSDALPQNV